jgi:hypothetical protein
MYNPFKDFNVGDFVLVRSHDPDLVPCILLFDMGMHECLEEILIGV